MNKYQIAAKEYHNKGYIPGHQFSDDPKFWREVRKESDRRIKKLSPASPNWENSDIAHLAGN